jgi:hypothetical protein
MIPQPPVLATSPAGTTNTQTNLTGQTALVSVSANGATMANYWVNAVSVATSAAQFMMSVPAGQTCALQYTVAVPVWYWSPYTPAVAASTVGVVNTTGKQLTVVFIGGTITVITVNGLTTNITQNGSAPVALPPGGTIAVTYSVAPVWAWMDFQSLVLANSNGTPYAGSNTVAPSGAAGYNPETTLDRAVHQVNAQTGLAAGVAN